MSNPASKLELSCMHCGYSLAGLLAHGPCPECGTPIAESLRPDRLVFADRGWLKTVHRGARLVEIAVGLWALYGLLWFSRTTFFGPTAGGKIHEVLDFGELGVLMLEGLGWWWVTETEGRDRDQRGVSSPAVLIRVMMGCRAACACVRLVLVHVAGVSPAAAEVCSGVQGVFFAVQIFAACAHLKNLAGRAPSVPWYAAVSRGNAITAALLAPRAVLVLVEDSLQLAGTIGTLGALPVTLGGLMTCFTVPFHLALVVWAVVYVHMIDLSRSTMAAVVHFATVRRPAADDPAQVLEPVQPDPPTVVE